MIEIIIYLYEKFLKKNDKFILSKAHASFPLYTIREKGFKTKIKTHLELDEKNGIYCTTGSLVMVCQLLLAWHFQEKLKLSGKIFVMISDVECQEGTT